MRGDKPGISDGKGNYTKGAPDCWLNAGNIMHSSSKGGTFCPHGRRNGTSYVLSGNVIPLWPLIRNILLDNQVDGGKYIQIVRCANPVTGERIVGLDVRYRQVRGEREGRWERSVLWRRRLFLVLRCRSCFSELVTICG